MRRLPRPAVEDRGVVLRRSDDAPMLTPLQREVLVLVVVSLTNREIAARLGTTPGWVGTQVGRIVQRLGLTRRAEVAAWGRGVDGSSRRSSARPGSVRMI